MTARFYAEHFLAARPHICPQSPAGGHGARLCAGLAL